MPYASSHLHSSSFTCQFFSPHPIQLDFLSFHFDTRGSSQMVVYGTGAIPSTETVISPRLFRQAPPLWNIESCCRDVADLYIFLMILSSIKSACFLCFVLFHRHHCPHRLYIGPIHHAIAYLKHQHYIQYRQQIVYLLRFSQTLCIMNSTCTKLCYGNQYDSTYLAPKVLIMFIHNPDQSKGHDGM